MEHNGTLAGSSTRALCKLGTTLQRRRRTYDNVCRSVATAASTPEQLACMFTVASASARVAPSVTITMGLPAFATATAWRYAEKVCRRAQSQLGVLVTLGWGVPQSGSHSHDYAFHEHALQKLLSNVFTHPPTLTHNSTLIPRHLLASEAPVYSPLQL